MARNLLLDSSPIRSIPIDQGLIFPAYMPIAPLPWMIGEETVIHEILARLMLPNNLVFAPEEFIDTLVPSLIVDIAILKLLPDIQSDHPGDHFSFNCTPASLCNTRYFSLLLSMIVEKSLDVETLILEITEDPVDSTQSIEMMERIDILRGWGLRIALNDFGTEGNGIARLMMDRFDVLKISPGIDFLNPRGRIIIEGVISIMGQLESLHDDENNPMRIIIEGIETPEHIQCANRINAHYAQGYLIQRPALTPLKSDIVLRRVVEHTAGGINLR